MKGMLGYLRSHCFEDVVVINITVVVDSSADILTFIELVDIAGQVYGAWSVAIASLTDSSI